MSEIQTNVTNAVRKVGGAAYCAPAGTALPTDTSTALDQAFKSMGYMGEDGVVNKNSPSVETKKAWGGDIVLTTQTERPDQWSFTLIERLNIEVIKAVYGADAVSGSTLSAGITLTAKTRELSAQSWVFDMVLKGGVALRVVLPNAVLTELGEISYKDNDTVGYALTLTAMPDASGNTHYEYLKSA